MRTLLILTILIFTQSNATSQTPAINFTAKDINGVEVNLESFAGKLVYLDFWASWCKPCRESFPFMSELHSKYDSNEFVLIAVNVDSDKTKMMDFLKSIGEVEFIVIYDEGNKIIKQYSIDTLPTSFFIKDGKILYKHEGFKAGDKNEIEEKINKYLELRDE